MDHQILCVIDPLVDRDKTAIKAQHKTVNEKNIYDNAKAHTPTFKFLMTNLDEQAQKDINEHCSVF